MKEIKILKKTLKEKRPILNLTSGAIHVYSSITVKQHLAWLYFAHRSIPMLKQLDREEIQEKVIKFRLPWSDVRKFLNYKSTDNKRLKEEIRKLVFTETEWNVFEKDQHRWGTAGLLVFFETISDKNKAFCEFAFSPFIQERLAYPEMYVKINLLISARFNHENALLIYMIALDFLNIDFNYGEKNISLEEMRRFCGVKEEDYKNAGDFYIWVIKPIEKKINQDSDMKIEIEVKKDNEAIKTSKIIGFKIKMSIKEEYLDFYKPKNSLKPEQRVISKQTGLFDLEQHLLEAPKIEKREEDKPITPIQEKKEVIEINNPELKKFYAEHKISMTTNMIQEKLKEIKETFHDQFENYLVFLMNYTNQEAKRTSIKKYSGFYVGLLKDASQIENYIHTLEKQSELKKSKQSRIKALLETELRKRYEAFILSDFEKYLDENIDMLEPMFKKILETTTKKGDFIYDILIIKNNKGIIDKKLLINSKVMSKSFIIGHLNNYKDDLGYDDISFDEWKSQTVTKKYLTELETEIGKSLT